ncbi:hypothetical protein ACLESO_26900 [Pyxidicoccus sp. 3LG]
MRHLAMACLCLAAAACGGDFSNDDLEYLNALPRREDLAAKLRPNSEGRAGGGLTARKTALAVNLGEASEVVGDTDETGIKFNQSVDGLLTFLENIRDVPPTSREPDRRVWGPFRDDKNPGFDVRFVMERDAVRFDYRLEYRRTGEDDLQWWPFLSGFFLADAGIRKGTGEVSLDVKRARQENLRNDLGLLDRLDILYQTKALPTRVELAFTPLGSQTEPIRYIYREAEGGLGEMTFRVPGMDLVLGGRLEDVELTTRWAPDGRGMGVLLVLDGDIKGAQYTECWNALGRVTFIARSWDFFNPTEGTRSTCPDFSALDR